MDIKDFEELILNKINDVVLTIIKDYPHLKISARSILFEEINCYAKDIMLAATCGTKPYNILRDIFNKTMRLDYKNMGHSDEQIDEKCLAMLMQVKNAIFPDDLKNITL